MEKINVKINEFEEFEYMQIVQIEKCGTVITQTDETVITHTDVHGEPLNVVDICSNYNKKSIKKETNHNEEPAKFNITLIDNDDVIISSVSDDDTTHVSMIDVNDDGDDDEEVEDNEEEEEVDDDGNDIVKAIDFDKEEEDEGPELITTKNGTMRINMDRSDEVETIIEHVCGKCQSTFISFQELKRHINLCRNVPKNEILVNASKIELNLDDFPEDSKKCFCCLEDLVTAHAGHVRCNFCPKSFKSHISLERHIYCLHSLSKDFPCEYCNAKCATNAVLELHKKTHSTSKPFACLKCGKDFTRKYHLDRHLQTSCVLVKEKKSMPCRVCKKTFSRVDNLREHLRVHMGMTSRKKDYPCPYCDKCFFGSSLLNIHIRTHTGDRPFQCDICPKAFPSNGALRKHRRKHTGEKPYMCDICNKSFSAKETLNRHRKIHTDDRRFECKLCQKRFIQATQLRAHMFNHTGENGFNCTVCSASFNRKQKLTTHMKKMHPNVEMKLRHECRVCDTVFTSKTDYDSHKVFCSVNEPSKCTICKRVYKQKASLLRHMEVNHPAHFKNSMANNVTDKKEDISTIVNHGAGTSKDDSNDGPIDIIEITKNELSTSSNDDVTLLVPKSESTNQLNDEVQDSDDGDNTDEDDDDNDMYEVDDDYDDDDDNDNDNDSNMNVETEENPLFLSDSTLKDSVRQLLALLVNTKILKSFGWPDTPVEIVLSKVIEQCGHKSADDTTCPDFTTKMRENVKLLFTTVIENDDIKSMLNNHTIDEVIMHVLKLAKV